MTNQTTTTNITKDKTPVIANRVTDLGNPTPGTIGAVLDAVSNGTGLVTMTTDHQAKFDSALAAKEASTAKKVAVSLENEGIIGTLNVYTRQLALAHARIEEVKQLLFDTMNRRLEPLEHILNNQFGRLPLPRASFMDAAKLGYIKVGSHMINLQEELAYIMYQGMFNVSFDVAPTVEGVEKYVGLASSTEQHVEVFTITASSKSVFVPAETVIMSILETDSTGAFVGMGKVNVAVSVAVVKATETQGMAGAHSRITINPASVNTFTVTVCFPRALVRAYSPTNHLTAIAARAAAKSQSFGLSVIAIIFKLAAKYAENSKERIIYISDKDKLGSKLAGLIVGKPRKLVM